MPNAIELLKQDHDKVRGLLKELTGCSDGAKKKRAEQQRKQELQKGG